MASEEEKLKHRSWVQTSGSRKVELTLHPLFGSKGVMGLIRTLFDDEDDDDEEDDEEEDELYFNFGGVK